MGRKVIFHVDVNSAFLSWTAAYRVQVLGQKLDLRQVPAVIGGNEDSRHGIVLAKSIPAKKYGIHTGEPLYQARQKCPGLLVAKPDYGLYVTASRQFISYLREVAPVVEQYSIDEAWADMTGTGSLYGDPVEMAYQMKDTIRERLGFTVNIGISSNKILAKMAGELEKPDKVHTLFPEEIQEKLWPLPAGELFLVGRATEKKLQQMGIRTVGDLAQCDVGFLRKKLNKHGQTIWQFANGYATDLVLSRPAENKGYGNSITLPQNIVTEAEARKVLLSLCETVGMRLRRDAMKGSCVAVQLRTDQFLDYGHQLCLDYATDITQELYQASCLAFRQAWRGQPLRQLGIQVSRVSHEAYRQVSLFTGQRYAKLEKMDQAVDTIRSRYGEDAILRARFLKGELPAMAGGLAKERRTGVTKEVPEI